MTKTPLKKNIVKGKFVVSNDRGMHTRPCTELVRCANHFKAKVSLKYDNHAVNAKSLLGILMLAATKGAKIVVEAEGEDAEEAVACIITLAQNNFHIQY
jgi:phosphocarrier protein HPr